MVTDSDDSADVATDDSINRRSGRFSAQNAASASSRSKSGTSSQFVMACTFGYGSALPDGPSSHPDVLRAFVSKQAVASFDSQFRARSIPPTFDSVCVDRRIVLPGQTAWHK